MSPYWISPSAGDTRRPYTNPYRLENPDSTTRSSQLVLPGVEDEYERGVDGEHVGV
jgi:hypothetical protein